MKRPIAIVCTPQINTDDLRFGRIFNKTNTRIISSDSSPIFSIIRLFIQYKNIGYLLNSKTIYVICENNILPAKDWIKYIIDFLNKKNPNIDLDFIQTQLYKIQFIYVKTRPYNLIEMANYNLINDNYKLIILINPEQNIDLYFKNYQKYIKFVKMPIFSRDLLLDESKQLHLMKMFKTYSSIKNDDLVMFNNYDNILNLNIYSSTRLKELQHYQNKTIVNIISSDKIIIELIVNQLSTSFHHSKVFNLFDRFLVPLQFNEVLIFSNYEKLEDVEIVNLKECLDGSNNMVFFIGASTDITKNYKKSIVKEVQFPEFTDYNWKLFELLLFFLFRQHILTKKYIHVNKNFLSTANSILSKSVKSVQSMIHLIELVIPDQNTFPVDYKYWNFIMNYNEANVTSSQIKDADDHAKDLIARLHDRLALAEAINDEISKYYTVYQELKYRYLFVKTKTGFEIVFNHKTILLPNLKLKGLGYIHTILKNASNYNENIIHVNQIAYNLVKYQTSYANYDKKAIDDIQKKAKLLNQELTNADKVALMSIKEKQDKEFTLEFLKNEIRKNINIHGRIRKSANLSQTNYKKVNKAITTVFNSLKKHYPDFYSYLKISIIYVKGKYSYQYKIDEEIDWKTS